MRKTCFVIQKPRLRLVFVCQNVLLRGLAIALPPKPPNPLLHVEIMARPKKEPTKKVQYRIPKSRYEEFEKEIKDSPFQTVSDYCRARDLNMKPLRKKATPERLALIAGLGSLGNIRSDMNQLLKDARAFRHIQPERVENLFALIEAMADTIQTELQHGDR